jgi:succinate dehydrogenase/fumarate reductase flavoprotein subunit
MSFAGFKVSAGLQVMRDEGSVIPNLYAIGEVIGAGTTSGAAYTNGMLVTPAITFGRLSGSKLASNLAATLTGLEVSRILKRFTISKR